MAMRLGRSLLHERYEPAIVAAMRLGFVGFALALALATCACGSTRRDELPGVSGASSGGATAGSAGKGQETPPFLPELREDLPQPCTANRISGSIDEQTIELEPELAPALGGNTKLNVAELVAAGELERPMPSGCGLNTRARLGSSRTRCAS